MRFAFFDLPQALVLLTATELASSSIYKTRFDDVHWDDDRWTIINNKLDQGHYQSRLSLANGYLGINVASLGPFFEADEQVNGDNINGWPDFNRRQTFASISGFFNAQDRAKGSNYPWLEQYGAGESLLSGVPHWAGLLLKVEDEILDASTDPAHISAFSSTLDMKAGLMTWKYDWRPRHQQTLRIQYDMFLHKLHVNQAAVQVTLQLSGEYSRNTSVTVYDVLNGDGALRTDFAAKGSEMDTPTIWSAVKPANISNVTAYIYSTLRADLDLELSERDIVSDREGVYGVNASSIAQSVQLSMKPGAKYQLTKFIGGASSDAFDNPQDVARNASLQGARNGFADLLKSHADEWASILTPDSVDSYRLPDGTLPTNNNIQELHITAVSNSFHLLSNTLSTNALDAAKSPRLGQDSISVCGLASDCYGGLVFWDAEVWIAPGLQVSHPEVVQQIMRYRQKTFDQAKRNVRSAYTSSKHESGRFSEGGAVYPWTSGRSGQCTPTGPCFDYEYHLNGDIGLLFHNHLAITGNEEYFREHLLPISNAVAWFYGELLDHNEITGGEYVLRNATDPDEYANNVDNAGFTTALIQSHFNTTNMYNEWYGVAVNQSWRDKAMKMRLPVNNDANIILEYASMKGSISVKQADVVLIDDLLDYPNPYSLSQLDYYAAKQSQYGPGMTYGVFSIVANEISPSGCSSYTYHLYGTQPYARAPWFQYSEQLIDDYSANGGTHPAFPFLTGMGGAHRVAIFGYLGLRIFPDRLDVDPSLPPQIQFLNYRTFYWQGHGINATSNATHTTLALLSPEMYTLPTANSTYATRPIPVTLGTRPGRYSLHYSRPLTIPNRQIGLNQTVPGNVLQCLPRVWSSAPYLPGQLPLAAIDGAASTKWQPAFAHMLSYLAVDLGAHAPYRPVKRMLFDWASSPPLHYEVLFSNTSSAPPFTDVKKIGVLNVTSSNDIEISEPWDRGLADEVKTYRGNTTNVTLREAVWTGRWALLGVWGNKGSMVEGASGATVAEWSIVAEDGEQEDEDEDADEGLVSDARDELRRV